MSLGKPGRYAGAPGVGGVPRDGRTNGQVVAAHLGLQLPNDRGGDSEVTDQGSRHGGVDPI
eukprot:8738188-Pyramimonas_sp.AAC.1